MASGVNGFDPVPLNLVFLNTGRAANPHRRFPIVSCPQNSYMIDTFLFIRIVNPILMKKYSLLGKILRFGTSITHQIWHLWWQNGDTNFRRILTFCSSWEGWLSCAPDGLVGLVQDILAMKGEFIKAFHKHRQEHYRGLSEGFLWHSTCQDNTIGRMWQVHVSAVMTRRTRFFGGTGRSTVTWA